MDACGVGLTVLNAIQGDLTDDRATLPRVPGHELVGRVAETGAGVATDLVGRLVAAYFYLSCGSCPECLAGEDNRCRRLAGYVGVHLDGGYGSVVTLPARNLIPMPDGLDPIAATVVPLSRTMKEQVDHIRAWAHERAVRASPRGVQQ